MAGGCSGDSLSGEKDKLDVVIEGYGNKCCKEDKEWLNSLMIEERNCPYKMQKVHPMFREKEVDSKCFDPLMVSIGPYHHGNPALKDMEKQKYIMACQFADDENQKLEEFYSKVMDVAKSARECYIDDEVGKIKNLSDKDFTRMMFLDGCFILEFIYCFDGSNKKKLKMKDNIAACIRRDLYLLENQLPFIVLKELMKLKFTEELWLKSFSHFIEKILGPPLKQADDDQLIKMFRDEQPHFLDVIRTQLVGTPIPKDNQPHCLDFIPTALFSAPRCLQFVRSMLFGTSTSKDTSGLSSYRSVRELKAVGIHFRPSKSRKFIDVTYKSIFFAGFLTLPPLIVEDNTKSMLLNMVAYEACPNGPADMGVSSYICFIDSLIDHSEDVKELRSKGILINFLGSDEQVAELFNEIDDNLVPNLQAYAEVTGRIEKHYKNKINIWVAEWFHDHFSSPWALLAFLGAILALILTFIQTYLSLHPRSP